MTEVQDFSFVPTETLIEELKRRSEALVLCFCSDRASRKTMFMSTFHGNRATCFGLTHLLREHLTRTLGEEEDANQSTEL